MKSFHDDMLEYKNQLAKGTIQKAYKSLMEYISVLRTHLKTKYPDHSVSSSIYFGYMDMTFFAFTPKSLHDRGLKVAIVFIHQTCRFEVWLVGVNKPFQSKFWKLLEESGFSKYPIEPSIKGKDAIIEHILVNQPNFNDHDALTQKIESGALAFIDEIESFLSKQL